MRWLDRLERHFHGFTIPQFPLFIASANGFIYLLNQAQPVFVERLALDPGWIRQGEWWRVITFLFVPPQMNPIFLVFWLLLLYQFAQALENTWGEFRFFFFYLLGAAATVIASVFILHARLGNVSLNTTLFLAYAALFPDTELLLFFIIPVKIKYLAWLMWGSTALSFFMGSYVTRVAIAASLANFFLFFGGDLWAGLRLRWDVFRNRRRMGR